MKNAHARLLLFSIILSLLQSICTAKADPQLRQILNKHFEAMGGMNNWHKVESIQLNGTIEHNGQIADICIIKKRPNQIRATVTLSFPEDPEKKRQFIRAHDGKIAWTANRFTGAAEMIQEELPKDEAAELLFDAGVLPPLIKLWREGAQLKLLASKTNYEAGIYVIEAKLKNTVSKYRFYISAKDYLLTHYESEHPSRGLTVTKLSKYNSGQDVLIPVNSQITTEQSGRSVLITDSIKVGVGIYSNYFEARNPVQTARNSP